MKLRITVEEEANDTRLDNGINYATDSRLLINGLINVINAVFCFEFWQ